MGNYYNFYAATAGSGDKDFIGEAPDSICPKGWRMVGNEGEKSWMNLFARYYGGTHQDANSIGVNIDTHFLSSIFSFLRSGHYDWNDGILYSRAWGGYYWSLYASSLGYAHFFHLNDAWLLYYGNYPKGYGLSLRKSQKYSSYFYYMIKSFYERL